jgi:hypothetical protein
MPAHAKSDKPTLSSGCSSACTVEEGFRCAPTRLSDGSPGQDVCRKYTSNTKKWLHRLASNQVMISKKGSQQTLDWYPQLTGVDGLLHLTTYTSPPLSSRFSGWFQFHLAASNNKHSVGGLDEKELAAAQEKFEDNRAIEKVDTMRLHGIVKAGASPHEVSLSLCRSEFQGSRDVMLHNINYDTLW